jgi:hypothetical protein
VRGIGRFDDRIPKYTRSAYVMRLILIAVASFLAVGCATTPTSAPTTAAPVTPAAAPATQAQPAAAATVAAVDKGSKSAPPGYRTKVRNGETVYCKKEATTGSRFEVETCMNAADLEALRQRTEQDREQFRKNQTICGTGGCGGG